VAAVLAAVLEHWHHKPLILAYEISDFEYRHYVESEA
jgi:hypothetical protein